MAENIEVFPWNHNLETGIPVIDEQHKQLVHLLNILVSHLAYHSASPEINRIFDQLTDYAAYHFQTEEEIWRQNFEGDTWEKWHKNSHDKFVDEVVRLKGEEGVTQLDEVIEHIVSFLTHWLAEHILESDRRMAKVVLALPSGISLEKAKEQANEEMAGSTRLLINTVMAMYDAVASTTVQLSREIQKRKQIESELREAQAMAESANIAKSMFLANISHEIRNPMGAIIGYTELLLNKSDNLTGEQKANLARISSSSEHLLSLINDILDFSKIEAGKLELEHVEFDCSSVLDRVLHIVEHLNVKGLDLSIECNLTCEKLVGDPTRLSQMLLNYLSNAIKFTEKGSVALRIRAIEESDHDILIRVEIEDSGTGISPEQQSRLFTAFNQADNSITRKHGGTGLGLAITKHLAKLMSGDVGVESILGKGSTFWFTARLGKIQTQPVTVASNCIETVSAEVLLKRDHSGKRVLVVEDDEFNRDLVGEMLSNTGLILDFAEDGKIALDKAQSKSYDLILMDMQMPEMSGVDSTKAIRQLPAYETTPIIAMTGNAFAEDRQTCLQAGMNDHLAKPTRQEELYRALVKWLGVKG